MQCKYFLFNIFKQANNYINAFMKNFAEFNLVKSL
jgi:hypothetical protein